MVNYYKNDFKVVLYREKELYFNSSIKQIRQQQLYLPDGYYACRHLGHKIQLQVVCEGFMV